MISRMIAIRKNVGLNQEQFAKRLGLSRSFVNQVETGKKNISDRTISDICREFHVNEIWLRTGEGEMFAPSPSSVMETLAIEYHLSQKDCALVEKILEMSPEKRQAVIGFMLEFAKDILDNEIPIDDSEILPESVAPTHIPSTEMTIEQEVEQEVERYRQHLLSEKKRALQASSAKGSGAG